MSRMTTRISYRVMFFCCLFSLSLHAQKTALRQPACLLDPGREVQINQVISAGCPPVKGKVMPWAVWSNRGDDFGTKYYVTEENLTHFHVVSGTGTNGLAILNPRDRGFRPKTDFLFHLSADFTPEALIHRKCVVLNSQGLIDSICKGLIDESRIPVYADPVVRQMKNYVDAEGNIQPRFLPLYSIYFVYQAENKRYLLGRDYRYDPSRPFADQVIGWVDAHRVFDYNNRLCFEPNYEAAAVRQRRCDTVFGNAKVFSTASELDVFLTNREAVIEPFWEEPNSLFLRQPRTWYVADTFNIRAFRSAVGKSSCAPGTKCFLSSFTNSELKADFFRFPYLGMSRTDKKTFQVAAAGRYVRNRKSNCDSLSRDKYNLKVWFILPDSLPGFYPVFFLNQLNERYSEFRKEYHACWYPQGAGAPEVISPGPGGQNNYEALRDSLMNHRGRAVTGVKTDCFTTLEALLEREPVNIRETNLIVLVNADRKVFPSSLKSGPLAARMAEKNCYLLAFDFAGNASFTAAVDSIAKKAPALYAARHNLPPFPAEWQQRGSCRFLLNYLLAGQSSIDTSLLKAPQILEYIRDSYDPLISTVNLSIRSACSGSPDTIVMTPNETRFRQGLEKIVCGCSRDIASMRILKKGFTRIKYQESGSDTWKAEVIMTENELQDLITQLDGFLVPQTGSTLTERICTLWQTLIGRFIGQQLLIDDAWLDLTICQVINRMIGSGFGYYCNEPVKRFTLRDICQGQENVQEAANDYIREIAVKRDLLRQKFNSEYFHINGDSPGAGNIRYYWVPVSMLP